MILVSDTDQPIDEAHLLLEPHEILELIEGFAGLLLSSDSHHDHVDDGTSALDLVVIYPGHIEGFPPHLADMMRQYFADKPASTNSDDGNQGGDHD